jgi:hypothetical protein
VNSPKVPADRVRAIPTIFQQLMSPVELGGILTLFFLRVQGLLPSGLFRDAQPADDGKIGKVVELVDDHRDGRLVPRAKHSPQTALRGTTVNEFLGAGSCPLPKLDHKPGRGLLGERR